MSVLIVEHIFQVLQYICLSNSAALVAEATSSTIPVFPDKQALQYQDSLYVPKSMTF